MTMPRWAASWVRASVAAAALFAAVDVQVADATAADSIVEDESDEIEVVAPAAKAAKASKSTPARRVKQTTAPAAPPVAAAAPVETQIPTAEMASASGVGSNDPWSNEWVDETMDDCLPPVWSHWTINLDAILWRRQTPDGLRLAMSNPGVDPDAASMTFDHEVGPRLALIRRGISGWDIELNYFGIEGFHSELDMPNAIDPRVPGDDPDGRFASEAGLLLNAMFVRYDSRLHSEELNLRRQLNETWTGLIGIRCIQLHENFHVDANFAPLYSIESENRLFGLQIGGEAKLISTERFLLWTSIKAGLFENNAEQTTSDLTGNLAGGGTVVPGVDPPALAASANQASFAGELGLIATYRVSESILLRAGYNVKWLDDVALASEQIVVNEWQPPTQMTVFDTSFRGLRTDGSLLFHGVTMGVELTW